VVTSAELTVRSPGHHAANHPFWSVASTCVPSDSTSVASVTPLPTRPSANEYESPFGVLSCDDEDSATWPAGTEGGVLELDGLAVDPVDGDGAKLVADTVSSDGPVMHEAYVLASLSARITQVNDPRVSVSTGCSPARPSAGGF
jgi:hypothetical protein